MKKILLFGFLVLMLFISACSNASSSYKDCGADKECVTASLLKGEKAKATISETEQQGDFTTTVKAVIRSEGKRDDGKVLLYQEISDMDVKMPEVPPLPEGSSEKEKRQYELSRQVLTSFGDNFNLLEGTSLNCALDPAKVEALGVDDAVNEAMQSSLDPITLKPAQNAPCSGTMLDAFANIMSRMLQMLTQALAQAPLGAEQ